MMQKKRGERGREKKDNESLDHLYMTNLPPEIEFTLSLEIELTVQIIHSCYECNYQRLRFSKITTENTLRQLSNPRV